jgi:hypothetical protein
MSEISWKLTKPARRQVSCTMLKGQSYKAWITGQRGLSAWRTQPVSSASIPYAPWPCQIIQESTIRPCSWGRRPQRSFKRELTMPNNDRWKDRARRPGGGRETAKERDMAVHAANTTDAKLLRRDQAPGHERWGVTRESSNPHTECFSTAYAQQGKK